jgi:hypothetical protein
MKTIKQLLCRHTWFFGGWNCVKCTKCEKVKKDPERNAKLMSEYFKKREEMLKDYGTQPS